VLFNDTNYVFTLTTIDTSFSTLYSIKPTILANLFLLSKQRIDTLINDSLFCKNGPLAETAEIQIEFADYNFDGVKDIVLPAGTDPRRNWGTHLYILDNNRKTVKYVDGFQTIGNPEPDTVNKMIISTVHSGQTFTDFYIFNANNDLIDLGQRFTFTNGDGDSLAFKSHFEEILRARRN
jgi:hypothetical protein